MKTIIGFEGQWSVDSSLAWGSALVRVCDPNTNEVRIVNAVSGQWQLVDDFQNLANELDCQFLPSEVPIESDREIPRAYVFGFRRDSVIGDFFWFNVRSFGGVLGARYSKHRHFYVFKDEKSFRRYINMATRRVFTHVSSTNLPRLRAIEIIRESISANPEDPSLHALRVYYSDNKKRAAAFATACIRTNDGRETFVELCDALDDTERQAALHYQEGAAKGGGLSLACAGNVFEALSVVDKRLEPLIRERIPIDDDAVLPMRRVTGLRAASAHLQFEVTADKNSTILDRITRHTALKLLSEVLRGDVPDGLETDEAFYSSLRTIIQPEEGTLASYQPVGSSESVFVSVEDIESGGEELRKEDEFSVLGYIEHVTQKRIQLRLSSEIREWVSRVDNGEGGGPDGMQALLTHNDFLHTPCVFVLSRLRGTQTKRVRYYLKQLQELRMCSLASISAIPSAVVERAFLVGVDLTAALTSEGALTVAGRSLRAPSERYNIVEAETWMGEYQRFCSRWEISEKPLPLCRVRVPVKWEMKGFARRFVVVLGESHASALTLNDLLTAVSEGWPDVRGSRNPWEELRRYDEWFVVDERDEADEPTISLTPEGRRAYSLLAMVAASS